MLDLSINVHPVQNGLKLNTTVDKKHPSKSIQCFYSSLDSGSKCVLLNHCGMTKSPMQSHTGGELLLLQCCSTHTHVKPLTQTDFWCVCVWTCAWVCVCVTYKAITIEYNHISVSHFVRNCELSFPFTNNAWRTEQIPFTCCPMDLWGLMEQWGGGGLIIKATRGNKLILTQAP